MNRKIARRLIAAAAAAASLLAVASPAAFAATPSAPLAVAPIAFHQRTLCNGLQVITVENHASPTVSVQVWYHVGGRNDPAGRSGFAHLFEHMMFKGTEYMRPEQLDRLTSDIGGSNNAFTTDDVTAYHEVVPSNYLETLLWAEAERMMNLKVDEKNFESERAVVEQEYRQRILASPYGRFFNALTSLPYLQHPYRRPTIGSIADLDAATLSDVVAFHARYYRPDNATLVVAGDFDAKQADAWVDRYFGAVARPAAPLPVFEGSEPAWTSDRELTVTAPKVPLPAVGIAWLAPPATSADAPALRVAAAVLSAGESARLNQDLVYRQQIASQAGFDAQLRVGPGLLLGYVVGSNGKPIDVAVAALLAEIRRIAEAPPTPAELDKVKTQLVTQTFISRQTPSGLASAIAEAAVLEGNAARIDSDLTELQNVTAADVQRVIRRYVLDAHKVTVSYKQGEAAT